MHDNDPEPLPVETCQVILPQQRFGNLQTLAFLSPIAKNHSPHFLLYKYSKIEQNACRRRRRADLEPSGRSLTVSEDASVVGPSGVFVEEAVDSAVRNPRYRINRLPVHRGD